MMTLSDDKRDPFDMNNERGCVGVLLAPGQIDVLDTPSSPSSLTSQVNAVLAHAR